MRTKYILQSILLLSVVIVIFRLLVYEEESLGMGSNQEPTATIVDVETGEPIEGAVAIAIWRKTSLLKRAWWEGGRKIPVRVEEVASDKEGKIYIEGFWDWHLSKNHYPHLTIYKPGYVCWDQNYIFLKGRRTDFGKENRVVRMEKWKEGYSYIEHSVFVNSVTHNETQKAKGLLFEKAFSYEDIFCIREANEINKKWRKPNRRSK